MPRTIDFKGTSEARAVCDPVFLAGLLQHANSAMCGDDLEMDDALPPDSANAKMECETKVARMNCRPNNMLRTRGYWEICVRTPRYTWLLGKRSPGS